VQHHEEDDEQVHEEEVQAHEEEEVVIDAAVAELPELFQLKCLSPALEARPHLNGNNPSIPRI
jgi:hypothetical protein